MTQAPYDGPNAAQVEYWNATAGLTWSQFHALLDRQVTPLGREALRVLAPAAGEHVLDIGCGCGQTTLDIAERVGARGSVTGMDISAPMLAVARRRPRSATAGPVEFVERDVQCADLGPGQFDAAYSRFGVMFFSDPAAAFRNVRAALRPGGRIGFTCWRPLEANGWMIEPLRAAQAFLPPLPPPDPTAPGPFALADEQRLRTLLLSAGFAAIRIVPFDALIGCDTLDESLQLALRVGPLGAALRDHPELAEPLRPAVQTVLSRHLTAEGVRMPAAVWVVSAENVSQT